MTDETKHTPGPWWIEERGDLISIIGPRENCSHNGRKPAWEMAKIDNYVFWDEPETEAEDRANARLIAAAPDLLSALKLVREMGWPETRKAEAPDRLLDVVEAALAKAEGRSK